MSLNVIVGGLVAAALVVAGPRRDAAAQTAVDHHVRSRPENIAWGWYPLDAKPVVTVKSGQTVRIDTLAGQGTTQEEDPVTYLSALGVKPEEVLQDVRDFWASRGSRPREGRTGHVLTGPIAIEGAERGDMLEIQILELAPRVPYGINSTSRAGGVLGPGYPGTRADDPPLDMPERVQHLIRTGKIGGREVAILSDRIHVPLAPFMGIMAVAPEGPTVGQPGVTVAGVQSTRPPGPYGGNMDFRTLTAGATLYLPVFQRGALFYTGDSHGAQGDGEVSGNALEQSLTGVFRFVLHKGKAISGPRAETATHHILMGIDVDLDRAMRLAVAEVVNFLVTEKGLTPAKALSLASLTVDFHVAEAVDLTQVVAGKIPKSIFLTP
jgi:acetamidase/formamidase